MSRYFHVHLHSKYSALDGMSEVQTLVDKAVEYEQPAIALTDHGTLGGVFKLYKAAKAADIKPFPGIETYIVNDIHDKDAKRYHAGLLALDYEGYKALVKLSSNAFRRPAFHRKPRIDFATLAQLHDDGLTDHLALTTGCYFGLPIQNLVTKGEEAATSIVRMYASWFPHTFVEIQQHYTPHPDGWDDFQIAYGMANIADQLGLPLVVTQDCHYTDCGDRHTHTLMKRMTMHGADPGDVGFPGDSYHFADWRTMKSHYAENEDTQSIWNDSLESFDHLLSLHNLSIPALDTYKFRIPPLHKNPVRKLRSIVTPALDAKIKVGAIPKSKRQQYAVRIEEELAIINETGFASYFLLVREIIDYCESQPDPIVVQARGSANGSLVNWLLGITDTDPIKWDIPFATFLTNDRAKPPDIDLDIEKGRRDEVIAWANKRFKTMQLGTWRKLAHSEEEDEEGKGSIFRLYMSAITREYSDDPKSLARLKVNHGDNPWEIAKALGDLDDLLKLSDLQVYSSAGAHAAGFLIDPGDGLLEEVIPTSLIASSDTTVTQVDMDDAEDAGFVKVDLLGLRTLSSTKRTLELMGHKWSYLDTIPFTDPDTYRTLGQGIPGSGIFQAEGWATAKGMRKMKPRTIREVVDAMALFRPATMQSGYTEAYLNNRKSRHDIDYNGIEVLEDHLRSTHGVFLYQEQVLGIARSLGLDPLTVQRMLKAIKVKHGKKGESADSTRIFQESHAEFIQAGVDSGLDAEDANDIWSMIEGFQRYSFKLAHAVPYGILCYRTAYLKTHYPHEFHAALLETVSWAQPQKEADYVKEVRRVRRVMHEAGHPHPIRLLPPNVNESGFSWTLSKQSGAIREGLLSIKGIGQASARAIVDGQPYKSLEDMLERLPAKAVPGGKNYAKTGELGGAYRALDEAGALDFSTMPTRRRVVKRKK